MVGMGIIGRPLGSVKSDGLGVGWMVPHRSLFPIVHVSTVTIATKSKTVDRDDLKTKFQMRDNVS